MPKSYSAPTALKSDGFLADCIGSLFLSNDMSDVTLRVKAGADSYKCFPAHRAILGACSPYWKTLLFGGDRKEQESQITLENVGQDTLEDVLMFIYNGLIYLSGDNLLATIMAANQFQMGALLDTCKAYVRKNMSIDVCCTILSQGSIDQRLTDIEGECKAYLFKEGESLATCPRLANKLSESTLVSMLKSDNFKAEEHSVFRMVQSWCAAHATDSTDLDEMKRLYATFAHLVRYPLMNPRHLHSLVRASGLVQEQLLLDAFVMSYDIENKLHSAWTRPRLSVLTWKLSWSAVKRSSKIYSSYPQLMHNQAFNLHICPKKYFYQSHLGVFLQLDCYSQFSLGLEWGMQMPYRITLVNHEDPDRSHVMIDAERIFEGGVMHGFSKFIEHSQLDRPDHMPSEFIKDDIMTFHVTLGDFSIVKGLDFDNMVAGVSKLFL